MIRHLGMKKLRKFRNSRGPFPLLFLSTYQGSPGVAPTRILLRSLFALFNRVFIKALEIREFSVYSVEFSG